MSKCNCDYMTVTYDYMIVTIIYYGYMIKCNCDYMTIYTCNYMTISLWLYHYTELWLYEYIVDYMTI